MSEFGQNLKSIVKKGLETISTTAENIAASTKQKVEEYNLNNQMKDIFASIGEKAYALYQAGTLFPDDMMEDLKNAAAVEQDLETLRMKKDISSENADENKVETTSESDAGDPGQETAVAAEYCAKDNNDVPVLHVEPSSDCCESQEEGDEHTPLSSAINDLFENMPPVDKMVDRVNNSLDDLGENLRKFSGEFDKQLNKFADQMMGNEKK